MKIIADLHIHSKYSRATSRSLDFKSIARAATQKGIGVVATSDFTHPQWLKEIGDSLTPAESGLFKHRDFDTRFLLSTEISCIYSKNSRVRKIHIVVFAPSLEVVKKINQELERIGNLRSDGRPILGLDAKELLKIVLDVSEDCLVVPAHCLLPGSFIHDSKGIKKIEDMRVGDTVYTHKGRLRKITEIYSRPYKGKIYQIRPSYFWPGIVVTPEHPFYAIKTFKDCKLSPHTICKPSCAYAKNRKCPHIFETYKPAWVRTRNLSKGDILIFPRFNKEIQKLSYISLDKIIEKSRKLIDNKDTIRINHSRSHSSPKKIEINKHFCRLMGYYLAEGYTNGRDAVAFCFSAKETEYIQDVRSLMNKIFNLNNPRIVKKHGSVEIIYFSKLLLDFFEKSFYQDKKTKRAFNKILPRWALKLPLDQQAEIFRGWWRGDSGNTVSRELMNQMKILLLRLGIIPSIHIETSENFNKKEHKIGSRHIKSKHDVFCFSNLSFFEDEFSLLEDPSLAKFHTNLDRRKGWIDEDNVYIPILEIKSKQYNGKVYNLEVRQDNSYLGEFAAVHNCMTPWFGIFGSKSGFDSIEECFGEYSKHIYAMETGLSADPAMLWRIPDGRKLTLISNSDAHSAEKLGRETNVFDTEMSYKSIIEAIKTRKSFLYTIEFYPQEGKYHYDGHRDCDISLSPEESKKYNNVCPVCGKPLTLGVANRVEELADRAKGIKPEGAVPFKSLIPLKEIIAEAFDCGVGTKRVQQEYDKLVGDLKNEFNILMDASLNDLKEIAQPQVAKGIVRVREGKVVIRPGYDGVFGKVSIFSEQEKKSFAKQKVLFD